MKIRDTIRDTNWKVSPTMSLFTQKIGEYIPRIQHKCQWRVHMLYPMLLDLSIKQKKIVSVARKARSIVQSLQSLFDQRPKSIQELSQVENYQNTSTSKEFATIGSLLKFGLAFIVLSSLFCFCFEPSPRPKRRDVL